MSDRDRLERWLDRHNHKLELIRTMASSSMLMVQFVVLTIQGLVLYHTLGFDLEESVAQVVFKFFKLLFGLE